MAERKQAWFLGLRTRFLREVKTQKYHSIQFLRLTVKI
ncbi:Hypothetical protein LCAKO_1175 [Lacticaseibacillus paracasei subsp. paracasei]|uniref:Uncharacterized protein n=1 Tax=Lacticaseibacillus paracasei subsp. paracasei TaxID=47714 RepID=A0AAP9HG34_LACPA|nr:Hypothetical protein LCAKO_1175 [Lacticaseibacillus paracasei subsp. paracasei]